MFIFVMQAQTTTISGNVLGEGVPLPGVSIFVKGSTIGAVTDFDGNYEIKANENATLVFSYVGFQTQEIAISGNTIIDVIMLPDVSNLEEIVVIGYGTQRKKELAGAVGQVKAEELVRMTTTDIGTALQGQISGVSVTSSTGQPGETANILIRGFSSLQDGQNGPLYVVDGIPYDFDPQLSISEIESIDILKDAASSSIYGTRGAGGVILITTKRGKVGQMDITLNGEYGVQEITSYTPFMESYQYTYLDLLRSSNTSDKPFDNINAEIHRNANWFTNNTNIEDNILNDLAAVQNHSLNVAGGAEGLTYNFNINLFDQEGIMVNSAYRRLNLRSNVQFKKGNWKVFTGLTFSRDRQERPLGNVFSQIFEYKPFQPPINLGETALTDVTEFEPDFAEGLGQVRNLGFVARRLNSTNVLDGSNTGANVQIDYNLLEGLKLTARGGAQYNTRKGDRIIPLLNVFNTQGVLIPPQPFEVTSKRTSLFEYEKLTFEGILNYDKSIGKHNLSLLLVNSIERSETQFFEAEKRDQANEQISVFDGYTQTFNIASNGRDNVRTLIGYLGRIQYNYDGKYLFSASIRRDGSSQFSPQNRWGMFPSVMLAWNVSDEYFWENLGASASSLKLRATYGTTGNDRFTPYGNQAVVNLGQDYVFGSTNASPGVSGSQTLSFGTIQERFANENVKWETSVESNLGFDLGLFKNSLTISGDYYRNEKRDLLFNVVNAPSTGVFGNNRNIILNVGNMENIGIEYAVNYRHRGKGGFNWNTGITYSQNTNRVTKTSDNNPIIFLDQSFVSNRSDVPERVSVITEGFEAASFFLRETDGVISTQEELDAYTAEVDDPDAEIGSFRYIDQLTVDTDGDGVPDAGDGILDQNDKVYKGSGVPDFEMGVNFNANYKGIDFSMSWFGSYGAEIMNGSKAYAYQSGTHQDLYYSWTTQNTTSNIPLWESRNTASYRGGSDFWLEDGSFIRLRNISLGYSLSKKIIDRLGISTFRIYLQGQNLVTLTKYTGYDPEVGNNGFSQRGIDLGTFPISRQYKLGLQVKF
ncbi:TonB-dependent receptor [Aquimarina sp. ERC-38]|uniref:SusC/RagA family TonB-linked outer membrane protein n=1 Tax=Aquimarina sp. ERC-38 TaxID=2949996 RepID=UPI0022460353|nr:TonB-dependent receptor [Aquimarina sp. ERC-38]UZO82286.1 TonB-dependent receptor [Aquimarina sp. ERC-38]